MNNLSYNNKVKFGIIGIVVVFVLLIITISAYGVFFANKREVHVLNDEHKDSSLMSDGDYKRIKKELYSLISSEEVSGNIDISIRWDTLQDKTDEYGRKYNFIIDVDKIEQSYMVYFDDVQVLLSCPEIGLSKYPKSFCIGSAGENDDSITVVFGTSLPYQGVTDHGEHFEVFRRQNETKLSVNAFVCPDDKAGVERINAAIDKFITDHGGYVETFERKLTTNSCDHDS